MNIFKKAFCRVYQTCFHLALPLLPYRKPEVVDSVGKLPYILKRKELTSVLIVTDKFISNHSSMQELKNALSSQGIDFCEYNEVQPLLLFWHRLTKIPLCATIQLYSNTGGIHYVLSQLRQ